MPRWRGSTVGRVLAGLLVLAMLLVPAGRVSAQLAMQSVSEPSHDAATAMQAPDNHHAASAAAHESHSHPCEGQKSSQDLACCFMGVCMADVTALPAAPLAQRVRPATMASYSAARLALPDGLASTPGQHPPDPLL